MTATAQKAADPHFARFGTALSRYAPVSARQPIYRRTDRWVVGILAMDEMGQENVFYSVAGGVSVYQQRRQSPTTAGAESQNQKPAIHRSGI